MQDRLRHSQRAAAARAGFSERTARRIRTVIADGAYDGGPIYDAIRRARPPRSPPKLVIPPGKPSIPAPGTPHGGTERERHAAEIATCGPIDWQKAHGYGKRSHAETAVLRLKRNGGDRLNARTFGA